MHNIMCTSTYSSLERDPSSATVFSTIKLSTCPWPNTCITSNSWCCTCCTECSWLIFCSYTVCSSTSCSFTSPCTCFLLRLSSSFMDISSSIFLVLRTRYRFCYSSTFSSNSRSITAWVWTIPCSLPLRRITVFISFFHFCAIRFYSPVTTDMFRDWNSSIFF